MKNLKIIFIATLVGAGAGYALTKKEKGKKPLNKTAMGAIAGGIAGIAFTQFTKKDSEEIKLSVPTPISIERT